jgi:hypothetical protein
MFDDMLILKLKLVGLRDMLMHTRKSGEVKWRLIDLGTIKGAQLWPAYSFTVALRISEFYSYVMLCLHDSQLI